MQLFFHHSFLYQEFREHANTDFWFNLCTFLSFLKMFVYFFSVDGHEARYEGLELARERDQRSMEAW